MGKHQQQDDPADDRSFFNLAGTVRHRLLDDMLATGLKDGEEGSEWRVLILDAVTVKIFSCIFKVSDCVDFNISVIEDLNKNRMPMPETAGLYFLSPCAESVARLMFDFGSMPMYRSAHVYFSSTLAPELLAEMRSTPGLRAHLETLREAQIEFSVVDRRTFHTDQERALQHLFGDDTSGRGDGYQMEVQTAARRVVSLLVSLKEYPAIRFRAAKPTGDDPVLEARALVAQRVAIDIHDRLLAMRKANTLPADSGDTCDLLVIDRGFDIMAPVIHEWTYEAMVADQLAPQNGLFTYDSETQEGRTEVREHMLSEADPLWVKWRHEHFAAASLAITDQLEQFRSVNKHAVGHQKSSGGADSTSEMDTKAIRRLVNALPQYREQLTKLAVHVELASKLSAAIEAGNLAELGALEQAVAYGDAGSKELIAFLTGPLAAKLRPADKLRLLVIFAAAEPDHMDATKQVQWQKLTKLPQREMETLANLEMLGVPLRARSASNFQGKKRRRPIRKEREQDESEQQFTLQRFVPLLADVVEDLAAGKLPESEYVSVSVPRADSKADKADAGKGIKAISVRTNRDGTADWARKALGGTSTAPKGKQGRRIIVFVVGGITHSEMRVAHKLSGKLNRVVVLGGTSVHSPATFLEHLHQLSSLDDIAKERK